MDRHLTRLRNEHPLSRVPPRQQKCIRYLTFNVNGVKTLFNHHPWNQLLKSLHGVFSALLADVVSLQELKVQSSGVAERCLAEGYKPFILVLKGKKGYSGVGLYVRIPEENEASVVRQALTVIKAEEGITGSLKNTFGVSYRDLPPSESIGGYLGEEALTALDITEKDIIALDSEGRCVIIETANNTVIVSLYCPANSQGTDQGQKFRMQFLTLMLERCSKLKHMGKRVVIMGDINVSPDLIDNAEGINERLKLKVLVNNLRDGGAMFEQANLEECLAYRISDEHREILNRYVIPTLANAPSFQTQLFYDTTRMAQKRALSLYTVWNTQTNSRQSNYGSRIDLILMSSKEDVDNIVDANTLPYILGSDHCPVFTDLDVSFQKVLDFAAKKLTFEAHSFFKIVKHYDISKIFTKAASQTSSSNPANNTCGVKRPAAKLIYLDRKKRSTTQKQQAIGSFFPTSEPDKNIASEEPKEPAMSSMAPPHNVVSAFALKAYIKPPLCEHDEPCILKTSMKPQTKGKKFWSCPRTSRGSSVELGEHRCNYFEWARRPAG